MDAYLTCPETKRLIWLGKPIRTDDDKVVYNNQRMDRNNHNDPLLNKVLWKFLAENAHKELKIVFSGEFVEDEYEGIDTHDAEAEQYVGDWPPSEPDPNGRPYRSGT